MARPKIKMDKKSRKSFLEVQTLFLSFTQAQGLARRTLRDCRATFADFNKIDHINLNAAVNNGHKKAGWLGLQLNNLFNYQLFQPNPRCQHITTDHFPARVLGNNVICMKSTSF